VAGKLQIVVGALLVASAFATGEAHAGVFAGGPEATFVTSEREILGFEWGDSARSGATQSAGATVMVPNGWRASLFVSHLKAQPSLYEDLARIRPSTFVGARLSRPLSKTLRLSFDAFNIFDRKSADFDYFANLRGAPSFDTENFMFSPGEPRGFRLGIRKTF
jgi:outer membrane receptor protein involved in Fe transport